MIEVIGIVASIIIIVGFLFENELQIRIADAIGALFFIIYGAFIGSLSVILLNSTLVLVQVINIRRLVKHEDKSRVN